MQLESLHPLDGRWPNDKVLTKRQPNLRDALKILETPAGHSAYEDNLSFDKQDQSVIMAFATQNNFTYSPRADVNPEQYGSKLPAWLGLQTMATQPVCVHQVSGELYGYAITFFLTYTPSSVQRNTRVSPGIEATDLVRKSIIQVKLPKVFPQMVLDSNKNDKSHTSTIPATFKNSQKLQLEGNFADYFDFYAPQNLQVNTLTVLAPNFMQLVMESAATFDVEFYGDELILITREPIYTPSAMALTLEALEAELQYLTTLMPSWNYQPLREPFDLLEKDYFDGTVTKIGRWRIKPGVMVLLLLLGFVAFACLILAIK